MDDNSLGEGFKGTCEASKAIGSEGELVYPASEGRGYRKKKETGTIAICGSSTGHRPLRGRFPNAVHPLNLSSDQSTIQLSHEILHLFNKQPNKQETQKGTQPVGSWFRWNLKDQHFCSEKCKQFTFYAVKKGGIRIHMR